MRKLGEWQDECVMVGDSHDHIARRRGTHKACPITRPEVYRESEVTWLSHEGGEWTTINILDRIHGAHHSGSGLEITDNGDSAYISEICFEMCDTPKATVQPQSEERTWITPMSPWGRHSRVWKGVSTVARRGSGAASRRLN